MKRYPTFALVVATFFSAGCSTSQSSRRLGMQDETIVLGPAFDHWWGCESITIIQLQPFSPSGRFKLVRVIDEKSVVLAEIEVESEVSRAIYGNLDAEMKKGILNLRVI